jgi:hypothetical protein
MRAPLGGMRGWDISSTLIVPLLADHLADAIELGEGCFQQQLVTHVGCISNLKLEGAVSVCVYEREWQRERERHVCVCEGSWSCAWCCFA